MKLYDEYEEGYCTIEWDEKDLEHIICYDSYCERLESLNGLQIVESEDK